MDRKSLILVVVLLCRFAPATRAAEAAVEHFRQSVQPILSQYCYDCHADGANKGGVVFDEFKSDEAVLTNRTLWLAVLKNVRTGLMPPQKKAHPSADEQQRLANWIKYDEFGIDPARPDPGRVTARRLNRVEYRNTILALTGVYYDTQTEFPPDDTGYGFDDIGDVLTVSPMLLEKYLNAAETIVRKAVPADSLMVPEKTIPGRVFRPQSLSYYQTTTATNVVRVDHTGHYQLLVDLTAYEKYVEDQFDYNKCRLVIKVDGQKILGEDFGREGGRPFHYELTVNWKAGDHQVVFESQPLTPKEKEVRSLTLHIDGVTIRGPLEREFWNAPKNYERFFSEKVPAGASERRAYARKLIGDFAFKAFRRPVDAGTINRLVKLAEQDYSQRGATFESGISHAMVAILASPRFLFREEGVEAARPDENGALVDEYSLASRLSYFLWSSMPDDELMQLAGAGTLRKNQAAQVKRMLADPRSEALIQNFTGQWLQARDIESVAIDSRAVLLREERPDAERERMRLRFHALAEKPAAERTAKEKDELDELRPIFRNSFRAPRFELGEELRKSMRLETEMYFSGIVHEDRSVMELIDSDYTYLNERLANAYGITNREVTGPDMRRVNLPADSPRGGVLTMGTVLVVTSNPTRTSPVKRGLFVLENVLGSPTPPPPPNIPPLEDSEKEKAGREPTLREALEIHRNQPLCASCHNRMDPLGLAFENFNALGGWREQEHGQTIDAAGRLITGESFKDIRELKHILATGHKVDFYRTLTEKLLTYALGRGLEYYDVETVDQIVSRLQREDGRFSALLDGIIESSPFQKRRNPDMIASVAPVKSAQR